MGASWSGFYELLRAIDVGFWNMSTPKKAAVIVVTLAIISLAMRQLFSSSVSADRYRYNRKSVRFDNRNQLFEPSEMPFGGDASLPLASTATGANTSAGIAGVDFGKYPLRPEDILVQPIATIAGETAYAGGSDLSSEMNTTPPPPLQVSSGSSQSVDTVKLASNDIFNNYGVQTHLRRNGNTLIFRPEPEIPLDLSNIEYNIPTQTGTDSNNSMPRTLVEDAIPPELSTYAGATIGN